MKTVTRPNWKIQHADATTRTISCAAKGKKIRLGGGQDVSISIEGFGDGDAKYVLGRGYQAVRLFDHGEKDEISVPEPAPVTPASPPSSGVADTDRLLGDLERLGDMRDRGLLTEDEFTQAKSKLLGRTDPS